MKLLFVLLILAIFQTGCKQCGSAITFSDTCDPEIVTDARPVAPTPPSPGYTLSSSSVNVAENGGTEVYLPHDQVCGNGEGYALRDSV